METADTPRSESRPVGIYIVVALLGLRALQLIGSLLQGSSLDVVDWLGTVSFIPPYPAGTPVGLVVRIVVAIFLVATLAAIVGMLRHEHWGWTMAIVTTGLILALNLGWWIGGEPRYLGMAINSIGVLYLNQRDVRIIFEEPEEPEAGEDHVTEAEDLELLQRHEPRLNFTYGEMFFPMSAQSYVGSADLLEGPTLRDAKVAIPAGSLTLESLAAAGDPPPGQAQFLRFTPRPLQSIELRRWRNRPDRRSSRRRAGWRGWVWPRASSTPGSSCRSWPAVASRAAPPPPRRSATTRSAPRTPRSSTTAG